MSITLLAHHTNFTPVLSGETTWILNKLTILYIHSRNCNQSLSMYKSIFKINVLFLCYVFFYVQIFFQLDLTTSFLRCVTSVTSSHKMLPFLPLLWLPILLRVFIFHFWKVCGPMTFLFFKKNQTLHKNEYHVENWTKQQFFI